MQQARGIVTLLLVIAAASVGASDFERILFPIVVAEHPGVGGTVWTSDVVVRNTGDVALDLFTSECYFRCELSRCILTACGGTPTPAHSELPFALDLLTGGQVGQVGNPGAILYVPRADASSVSVSLRLRELTQKNGERTLELPVVRENGLFGATLTLPDVPMQSGSRTHIRLYGVESPSGDAAVRVSAIDPATNDVVFTTDVTLAGFDGTPLPGIYDASTPSYWWLDLSALIQEPPSNVRVTVEPQTQGLKFWAMANVTNNSNQHLTLITPQ